ncbi:MAG: ParA family protein [Burkholderiales bacterium]|nr:ParA family protein [Burkholderiales bacterium]
MQTILVANPKGGSGKTTLATNIAGWLAGKRQRVGLQDVDPQGSSTQWLARRPNLFPPIAGFTADAGKKEMKDVGIEWLVVDSAAGTRGDALRDAVRRADAVVVPVSPSSFDMAATAAFLSAIAEYKAIKEGLAVGLVAMRVDARTRAAGELDEFLQQFAVAKGRPEPRAPSGGGREATSGAYNFPLVTHLRDTQVYVYCARDGHCVFDLPRSRGEQDWEQWKPLTRWIARHAAVRQ